MSGSPSLVDSYRVAATTIALSGLCGYVVPLVLLPSIDASYHPWVRLSHLALVATCGACFLGLREERLRPVTALYVIGIAVAASNALLLFALDDWLHSAPTLILILLALATPIPFGVSLTVCGLSLANLVAAYWIIDGRPSIAVIALFVVAATIMITITQVLRRQREATFLRLRSEALAAAEQARVAAERERELAGRIAQDEKLRSLGSLAGGIVHDLNNLLVPIMGHSDLLAEAGPTAEVREQAHGIREAAARAGELTRQLNAFAGLGSGPRETLDLGEEVERIQRLVWRGLPDDATLRWDKPAEPVWVLADRAQLFQIVTNLLTNAVEAVGGSAGGCIELQLRRHEGSATISIVDDGPGIPESMRERLFEPFTSTKGEGRGMGLAAVNGAVKRIDGDIAVRSTPQGTRIDVSIPLTAPPSPSPPERVDPPVADSSVLVVDDEPHVRRTLERMLASTFERVASAASGEEAVALVRAGARPQAVVMDLRMPGMGGPEAIRAIRDVVPDQPFVVCTGHSVEPIDRLGQTPHLRVVTKPLARSDLVEAVRQLL